MNRCKTAQILQFHILFCVMPIARQVLSKRSLLLTSKHCYRSDRMARPHISQTMESRRKKYHLLKCAVVWSGVILSTFQNSILRQSTRSKNTQVGNNNTDLDYSSSPKEEAMCSSKKSVNFYKTDQLHITENRHRHEDVKFERKSGFQLRAGTVRARTSPCSANCPVFTSLAVSF